MEVDVVVLTRNSARTLRKCLEHIKSYIDCHRVFIIDSGSTDDTVKIAKEFGEVHRGNWNLAEGRTYAIKLVDCPMFTFIDSDVYIPENWYEDIMRHFTPDVGAVQGRPVPTDPFLRKYSEAHFRLQSIFGRERERGGTHNTIIRTEAVKDIEIPSSYRIGEDWFIRRYVEGRGYKWVYDPTITVEHESSRRFAGSHMIKEEDTYRELVKLGFVSKQNVIRQFLASPLVGSILTLLGGDPRFLKHHIRTKYHYLRGALSVS